MNLLTQLRLQRFVNREPEIRVFRSMIEAAEPTRPITVIWGEGGMGKSTLLDFLEQECHARNFVIAKLLWSETCSYDYLGAMRKLRDDLGSGGFSQFNALVNFFTVPPTPRAKLELVVEGASVVVAQGLQNQGSIGSITGAEIKIEDLNVLVPRADLGIGEAQQMSQLTDMFRRELRTMAAATPTILFLDAFEKCPEVTRSWVYNELAGALLDGRLEKLRIVISGRIRPAFDDTWWNAVNEMHLAPLTRDHVIQYIDKSQLAISAGAMDDLADTFLAWSDGVPGKLDNAVRSFAQMRERRAA